MQVAGPASVPTSEEGPNEAALSLLRDNNTLLAVYRVDGGDGSPHHRHTPYMASNSTDGGKTWSTGELMPPQLLSAKPQLLRLESGALLLSGGRPGLKLWANPNGDGKAWETYDIPYWHNRLMKNESLQYVANDVGCCCVLYAEAGVLRVCASPRAARFGDGSEMWGGGFCYIAGAFVPA